MAARRGGIRDDRVQLLHHRRDLLHNGKRDRRLKDRFFNGSLVGTPQIEGLTSVSITPQTAPCESHEKLDISTAFAGSSDCTSITPSEPLPNTNWKLFRRGAPRSQVELARSPGIVG